MSYHLILRADGGVSLMQVIDGDVAEAVRKWEHTAGTTAVSHRPAPSGFAFDKRWRNAYRHSGGKVDIDLAAAKELRRKELLVERDVQIVALNAVKEIAEENGDKVAVAEILAARKALRELEKAVLPDDLAVLDKHEPQVLKDAKSVREKHKSKTV